MNENQKIVEKVADLIKTYYTIQGYSGLGDSVPHSIASALLKGYITCQKCFGTGKTKAWGDEYDCSICHATGKINFKVDI
jgi:hypothetical protein